MSEARRSMRKPEIETCEGCRKTIACRCGPTPESTYHYESDHAHYCMGAIRCGPCREVFDRANRDESARKFAAHRAAYSDHVGYCRQHGECPDDGIFCSSCCPHEDVNHGLCNDCEENVMGDMIDAAMCVYEGDR